jgi:hypothetical protein
MKIEKTMYSETNYGIFKSVDGNRNLNMLHLERLKKSVSKKQLIIPIITNEKFEIIDGQHRFEIFKNLGLPIYFIVAEGYGLEECHLMNTNSKSWSPDDFLNGYADLGKEDYVSLRTFRDKYKFLTIKMCQILLVGGQINQNQAQYFKEGKFKIVDYSKACEIAEKMKDFEEYKPFSNSHFQLALYTIIKNKNYNHSRMLQKLEFQGNRLVKEVRVSEYLETLTEIYNFKSQKSDRLYFNQTL